MDSSSARSQNKQQINLQSKPKAAGDSRWQVLLKRFGLAGFLFFFIKGLVWIAVFALGWKGCSALRDTESASMGTDDAHASAHEVLALQQLLSLIHI